MMQAMPMVLALISWIAVGGSSFAQPPAAEVERVRSGLERMLRDNIVPFWYPQAIDEEGGGYRLNHDESGAWQGPTDKALVGQARTLWFFSRLYNAGYGSEAHLQAAEHGYAFLRDALWDDAFGGFFWSVSADGRVATRPHKHLYGQAFALYALAEYAQASGRSEVLQWADSLFYLIEEKAHDAAYGGYLEWFRRDWEPGLDSGQYMGVSADVKLMNTHLHLMEALTTYWQLSADELARERLLELLFVQSNAVVRKGMGACTDQYTRDWTPLLNAGRARVSYGHDVENTWLLAAACRAVGVPNGPLIDLYRLLVDNALHFGFDSVRGGFYEAGALGVSADARNKVWWVQAEGLVALLSLFQLTGDRAYWNAFIATYDWIEAHQVDWQGGDWHAEVTVDGRTSGDKANAWKSPYHNGRAVLECLARLENLSSAGPEERR